MKRLIIRKIIKPVIQVWANTLLFVFRIFFKFRIYPLKEKRIGHLLANTEFKLREQKNNKEIVVFLAGAPCNDFYIELLRRKAIVIRSPLLFLAIEANLVAKRFYAPLEIVWANPSARPWENALSKIPALCFNKADHIKADKIKRNMGFEERDWYICVHSRDPAYLKATQEEVNFNYHSYRDCNIKNYLKACGYIVHSGGKVLRMGAVTDCNLEDEYGIIDYSNKYRSEFGDIYFPGNCKFFLGNTAGLFFASSIFGIPVAAANVIPIQHAMRNKGDLFIPKKIWCKKRENYLSFKQIIELGYGNLMRTEDYYENDLVPIENDEIEILELVQEMLARIDGKWKETEEDIILQKKFKGLFLPDNPSRNFMGNIGATYLRKNKHLLE